MSHKGTVFFQLFKVVHNKTKYVLLKLYIIYYFFSLKDACFEIVALGPDSGANWVTKLARAIIQQPNFHMKTSLSVPLFMILAQNCTGPASNALLPPAQYAPAQVTLTSPVTKLLTL